MLCKSVLCGRLSSVILLGVRVFSRNVVWGGGNYFFGERKCEKHPKNKQNLLVFGGKFKT